VRGLSTSGLNQTLGTLTSAQNTALTLRRTGITTGLKRMISTTSFAITVILILWATIGP